MKIQDDQLRDLLASRADRARATALDDLLASALASPARSAAPLRLSRGGSVALIAAVVLLAALVATTMGPLSGLLWTAPGPSPSTAPTPSATAPATPVPTDLALTPPPYVRGTCPVTPVTDLVAGSDPEVVASGIRWRWGTAPWQAGIGQKVVLLSGVNPDAHPDMAVIAAERLPIGAPTATPLSARYPKGSGPGFVFGIGLPEPGCWLLTAIGATARSSVVVEAGPKPADAPSAGSQDVPTSTSPLVPLAACPTSPVDMSNGYRRFVDQSQFWGDPDPSSWVADKERKLVVGPSANGVIAVASRVGVAGGFVTDQPVFTTPPPGSGSIGVSFTIPTAGCWSFTFIEGDRTSTIVAEVGPGTSP